jgi:colicin import membrane protein
VKKLLVGSILLSLSLIMGACDQWKGKNAETSKKETAVKPEKKINERELNKKSESQQIQNEQKDLSAYATKVEEERKAKELAE